MIKYQAGDEIVVTIDRQGLCASEGIAHLPDETMVVVKDAGERVGETFEAIITGDYRTYLGTSLLACTKM